MPSDKGREINITLYNVLIAVDEVTVERSVTLSYHEEEGEHLHLVHSIFIQNLLALNVRCLVENKFVIYGLLNRRFRWLAIRKRDPVNYFVLKESFCFF